MSVVDACLPAIGCNLLCCSRLRLYNLSIGHEVQDRASLEMGRRIAAGLREHPEWIELARASLKRWSRQNLDAAKLLQCDAEWLGLLDLPIEQICAVLTAETDEGQRLRQNSPFAGVLSPREVREIKARCRNDARTT